MNPYFKTSSDWAKVYYGKRIQKIPVDGGFSCPNRDGRFSKEGCLYCNNKSFTPFYTCESKPITEQLQKGIAFFSKRYNCKDFFAYFQTYTGTYAPLEVLEKKYTDAINYPGIRGIIISTRPDCIDNSIIELLLKLKKTTYVRVEVGVESFDDKTLETINRCHNSAAAIDSINLLRNANIDTSAHLIFGLPNEPLDAATSYAKILSDLRVNFVKLHHLQIVRGSKLAEMYEQNPSFLKLHTLESYIEKVAEFLTHLSPEIYVERFINRVPPSLLLAPKFGDINENKFTEKLITHLENFIPTPQIIVNIASN